jgi:hypothetical protein
MHYPDGPTELKAKINEVVVILQFPGAERLGHANGSTVVVGMVFLRLEEGPNESMGLQSAGHESGLTRCGTESMARMSGRPVTGLVGRARPWVSGRA